MGKNNGVALCHLYCSAIRFCTIQWNSCMPGTPLFSKPIDAEKSEKEKQHDIALEDQKHVQMKCFLYKQGPRMSSYMPERAGTCLDLCSEVKEILCCQRLAFSQTKHRTGACHRVTTSRREGGF